MKASDLKRNVANDCVCDRCPTFTQNKLRRRAYCSTGSSGRSLSARGCICSKCATWHEYSLSSQSFCNKGSSDILSDITEKLEEKILEPSPEQRGPEAVHKTKHVKQPSQQDSRLSSATGKATVGGGAIKTEAKEKPHDTKAVGGVATAGGAAGTAITALGVVIFLAFLIGFVWVVYSVAISPLINPAPAQAATEIWVNTTHPVVQVREPFTIHGTLSSGNVGVGNAMLHCWYLGTDQQMHASRGCDNPTDGLGYFDFKDPGYTQAGSYTMMLKYDGGNHYKPAESLRIEVTVLNATESTA